ncbi:hypothetical protein [Formosa algae]|uniref:Outer membrane protein beta-barrel domain-containing protein n=1 Tax=Formosa algae TaxID=225843 RepID=A0A9X0YNN1_9FLAO|nr:hypothetical protein [Formosa algae]MBP1840719.1 hypothetical protein [Formosa algae]MDQ0335868.1 hypothetical protein [Formosa algae]OEI81230.1 hypothetical protein AST99_06115 [Formosa algae]
MKIRVYIILISGLFFNRAHAQFANQHSIYTSGEINFGNYIGMNLNLNYVYNQTYSFKLGYTGHIRTPKSQPKDYSSGLGGLFSFGFENPYDQLETIQMGVGKIYNLNNSGTIRLNLSVGAGYTIIRQPENWQYTDSAFLSENYTWNYRKHSTASFILNPKIEFPISRFYGFTVSPLLILNKDSSYIGIGLGQMIGILKPKKQY